MQQPMVYADHTVTLEANKTLEVSIWVNTVKLQF